jgi:hypothetical protein
MQRRKFIILLGGTAAAAWPLTAGAQQLREMRRIAVLMGTATTDLGKSYLATFLQRLEQLGWANGRNARIETRWWTGTVDEMRPVVGELIAFSPDAIMAFSNPAVALLKSMASTIPVACEQRWWDGQAECLRGLQIDDQLEFSRRLHRQVRRFLPLEDAIDILRRFAHCAFVVVTVADESPGFHGRGCCEM